MVNIIKIVLPMTVVLLLSCCHTHAADVYDPTLLHAAYTLGQVAGAPEIYHESSDRSWTTFDPDGAGPLPSRPHLNAVSLWIKDSMVGAVVDDPGSRIIMLATTGQWRESLTIRSLYLQQHWQAMTSYNIGDKVSGFTRQANVAMYPNTTGYWTCTRAGVSGQNEPIWTPFIELPASWSTTYTAIAPSPIVAYDSWSPSGDAHVLAAPWAAVATPVSISAGACLNIVRTMTDHYIYIGSTGGIGATHGPQFSSMTYNPADIYKRTVATTIINDPDPAGVEWTYTSDTSIWAFEGPESGAVVIKKGGGYPLKYLPHGDTYSRTWQ